MNSVDWIIEDARFVDGGEDDAAAARTRHKEFLPSRAARRMTHLGILVSLCLRDWIDSPETPVVYASAFGESRALEAFIDTFPQPSPMLFQTSIHPSAVEQALIPSGSAVRQFFPIIGDRNLAGSALDACRAARSPRVALVGGEESGSWLAPHTLASDRSFAFGLLLKQTGAGIGKAAWSEAKEGEAPPAPRSLVELADAIERRADLSIASPAHQNRIALSWL